MLRAALLCVLACSWQQADGLYRPARHACQGRSASEAFVALGIAPDILPEAPASTLTVEYGVCSSPASPPAQQPDLGNVLTPTEAGQQPRVSWPFDPANPGGLFTLLMIDPDAPPRNNVTIAIVRHWLVTNIPGASAPPSRGRQLFANTVGCDGGSGDNVTAYVQPGAPLNTGFHRFILAVFRQPAGSISVDEALRQTGTDRSTRADWQVREFIQQHGLKIVAGNVFLAKFDESVVTLFANFVNNIGSVQAPGGPCPCF